MNSLLLLSLLAVVLVLIEAQAPNGQQNAPKGSNGSKGNGKGEGKGDGNRGGFKSKTSLKIVSCQQDRQKERDCVDGKIAQAGVKLDALKQCFDKCQAAKGDGKDKNGGKDSSTSNSDPAKEKYRQCLTDERQKCVVAQAGQGVVEINDKDDAERKWRQFGWRKFGGGHKGAKDGSSNSNSGNQDFIGQMMKAAAKCGQEACVKAALPAEFLVNTSASSAKVKQAMCGAYSQCDTTSPKCTADRAAARAAACTCKAKADQFKQTCQQQTGYQPPVKSAKGSGGTQTQVNTQAQVQAGRRKRQASGSGTVSAGSTSPKGSGSQPKGGPKGEQGAKGGNKKGNDPCDTSPRKENDRSPPFCTA